MQAGTVSGVDIFDEADYFQVIMELPGAKKEDISVNVQATTLKIVAMAGAREYQKHIDLGVPVRGKPEVHYNNGVLAITLGKKRP
jgi:HSP20 family molecular chaperone IbpA